MRENNTEEGFDNTEQERILPVRKKEVREFNLFQSAITELNEKLGGQGKTNEKGNTSSAFNGSVGTSLELLEKEGKMS